MVRPPHLAGGLTVPRYSTLAYGLAAGLMAVAGVGLVATLAGWPVNVRALGFLFGLCVGAVVFVEWGVWLVEHRHDAAVQRERAWVELDERKARLAVPEPAPAPAVVDESERAWALALERFFRAGDAAGSFSINAMSGVVGSDVWGRLTDFYCSETGGRVLRIAPGNVGTVWGWGWQLDTVLQRVALRHFPHPTGPAPDVNVPIQSATQRKAPRKSKTQAPAASEMVVDA